MVLKQFRKNYNMQQTCLPYKMKERKQEIRKTCIILGTLNKGDMGNFCTIL